MKLKSQHLVAAIFVIGVAAIGTYILIGAHADSPTSSNSSTSTTTPNWQTIGSVSYPQGPEMKFVACRVVNNSNSWTIKSQASLSKPVPSADEYYAYMDDYNTPTLTAKTKHVGPDATSSNSWAGSGVTNLQFNVNPNISNYIYFDGGGTVSTAGYIGQATLASALQKC
jgi:hypothetical protein